jgi:ribonuclease VapC
MIVDTSALLAILRDEPGAAEYAQAIERSSVRRISAASFLETAIVIDASGDPVASRRLDEFLQVANFIIEPVTAGQARIARAAYRDFGKGRGHPAQLNFGDCFVYALAKDSRESLLFKGLNFGRTDIRSGMIPEGDEGDATQS